MSLHLSRRSPMSRNSAPGRPRSSKLRRSRVAALATRFGIGMGVERLEDRRMLAAGALDTTFNPTGAIPGTVIQNFAFEDNGNAVAVQADGKTLIAGTWADGSPDGRDFAVARFNVDGSLDTAFGTAGLARVNFNNRSDEGRDVLVDAAGNILVIGFAQNSVGHGGIGIARLTADGLLDSTYGSGGKTLNVVTGLGGWSVDPRGAAFDGDGNIVVAGVANSFLPGIFQPDFAVARYTPDGFLDPSFSPGGFEGSGITFTDFGGGFRDEAFDVAAQADGKIIAVGRGRDVADPNLRFALARYNTDGTLDASFGGGDGLVTTHIPAFGNTRGHQINAVALDGGKIVVAGSSQAGSASDVVVARYNSDGSMDTSFDGVGDGAANDGINDLIGVPFGSFDTGEGIVIQPNGAILVAGTTDAQGGRGLLLRLTTNGALDATFDGDGIVTTDASPTPGDIDQFFDLALTADGKVVVGGRVAPPGTTDFLLARYDLGLLAIDAGGPYNLDEPGGTIQLNGSSTASGSVFEWDLDGDNIFGETGVDAANGDENVEDPFYTAAGVDGPAAITVALRVTIGVDSAIDTATINVANLAPTATFVNGGDVNEGSSGTVSFTGQTDPSAADLLAGLRYAYDFGNDNVWDQGSPTYASATTADSVLVPASFFADGDGTVEVRARIIDKDGGFSEYTTVINVLNVAPTLTLAGAATVAEGSSYRVTVGASDPGADTIQSWTIDWGDGSTPVTLPGNATSATHVYADGGNPSTPYTITATAVDEDGSYDATLTVNVLNVAPAADAGGPYATFDDTPIMLHGTATDPAGVEDPLSYLWDLDDDGVFGEIGAGAVRGDEVGADVSFNPVGLGNTTYEVALRVTDGDGGETTVSTTVQVLTQGTLLIDGVLHVVGGNSNDLVIIGQTANLVSVAASFNGSNPAVFDANDIQSIDVRTRGGNDIVITSCNVLEPMKVDGG
ncbi:MAG TPA: PKD domain-containing protein [Lacipirellulaceae bacterium]|nr:PKD domain-containing protein [Lacipirellulaceae bacterium]